MKYTEMMIKLGLAYNQPAIDKTSMGDIPNLVYSEAFSWIEDNIPEGSCALFYKMIREHFSPTSTAPFPHPKHLSEIWLNFCVKNDYQSPFSTPEGFNDSENVEKLALPDPAAVAGTWQDVLADDARMSEKDLLKKYGRLLCQTVWTALGARCYAKFPQIDNHVKFMEKIRDDRPSAKELKKYIEEANNLRSPFEVPA
jgi:hypothetical protein